MQNGNTRVRRKRKRTEEIFKGYNEYFPQIKIRYRATDPGSSGDTKQDKCPKQKRKQSKKTLHLSRSFSNYKKSKKKKRILKEAREK